MGKRDNGSTTELAAGKTGEHAPVKAHGSKPASLWLVVLAGAAWLCGVGFLVAMVVMRYRTDAF